MLYPHLMVVSSDGYWFGDLTYYVVIAHFNYSPRDWSWMGDEALSDDSRVLGVSIDIIEKKHKFDTEQEALAFIANWWRDQPNHY